MLLLKNDGHNGFTYDKNWGGCHQLLLVYDASKLSTVYVLNKELELFEILCLIVKFT